MSGGGGEDGGEGETMVKIVKRMMMRMNIK